MKKRDRAALAAYIRQLGGMMELRDWVLELADEPCDPTKGAHVFIPYGHRTAIVSVPPDFRTVDRYEQRERIVHELVHCHIEVMVCTVQQDLESHLGRQSDSLFWRGFNRQMELSVSSLARSLAKHLPLIDWPGA